MEYHDAKELKLLEEIKDIDLTPLITQIDLLKNGDYWQSKNERLFLLESSEYIAQKLAMTTTGFRFTIQELIAILANQLTCRVATYEQCLFNATNVIEVCDGIIYEIIIDNDIQVNSFYELEDETYKYLDMENSHPPMMIEPLPWTKNNSGGYYFNNIHCILGNHNSQHQKPQALDVLNLLQEISWELDPEILALEELPSDSVTSNPEALKQFIQMRNASKDLYATYAKESFYFIWQFDKRGRMYSKGY